MARNAHGGFSEKILVPEILGQTVPKWPKNRPFGFFSKSALRIILILCIWLEGIIALILPKTACSAKFRFRSYGPKRPKNRVFSKAHISSTVRAIENLIRFLESSVLSLQKTLYQIFRISTPSPSKLSPNIGTEKCPNSGFSIFSSLDCRIFFISHSQLEDHKGLLQWRFHIHCIFGSEVIAIFGKWAQNLGPKTGFPIISLLIGRFKLKLYRQLEDH